MVGSHRVRERREVLLVPPLLDHIHHDLDPRFVTDGCSQASDVGLLDREQNGTCPRATDQRRTGSATATVS